MKELNEDIAAVVYCNYYDDKTLVALRADTDGRMTKAINDQNRFNKWGKHYLRAICRSH